jgi:hypothetical protein
MGVASWYCRRGSAHEHPALTVARIRVQPQAPLSRHLGPEARTLRAAAPASRWNVPPPCAFTRRPRPALWARMAAASRSWPLGVVRPPFPCRRCPLPSCWRSERGSVLALRRADVALDAERPNLTINGTIRPNRARAPIARPPALRRPSALSWAHRRIGSASPSGRRGRIAWRQGSKDWRLAAKGATSASRRQGPRRLALSPRAPRLVGTTHGSSW